MESYFVVYISTGRKVRAYKSGMIEEVTFELNVEETIFYGKFPPNFSTGRKLWHTSTVKLTKNVV